ncbi:MAG TPA: hypothetical protein VM013_03645 [Dehalococcoidia bacterium]|nr:hypothetical protein [Dehalococcoidia bacterium]
MISDECGRQTAAQRARSGAAGHARREELTLAILDEVRYPVPDSS